YDYTGQPVVEALGRAWTGALHEEDREAIAGRWNEAVEFPKVFELECRLRGRDGAYRWFLCRAVPEIGDEGRTIGWLGTYTDFDERRRMLDAAREAIHARDELLSVDSPEL